MDTTFTTGLTIGDTAESFTSDTDQIDPQLAMIMPILTDVANDYEHAKHLLSLELISTECNKELLRTIPHEDLLDMSIAYRIRLSEKHSELRSVLITNDMLDHWGITAEQLKQDAMDLAPENYPYTITGMCEVLAGSMDTTPEEMLAGEDEIMFVASNESRCRGAGVIAYPGFLDKASELLGGDFFILPSSIHEVILVKDNGQFTSKELSEMVADVNSSIVKPEERLTDSAYRYDSNDHIFELASEHEARMDKKGAETFAV